MLLVFALAVAVLLALFAIAVHWLLQPANLTHVLLQQAGDRLGLTITASGIGQYRLRGQPQLVLREVTATQAGQSTPVFSAERLLLSLPWSTLQSRGQDLTITRVEVDAPVLNLPAFSRWQASRPPGDALRVPTLTHGLRIRDALVQLGAAHVDDLNIDLPTLAADAPLTAQLRGRYVDTGTRLPFDLLLAMTAPNNHAGIAVIGGLNVQRSDWRINGQLHARGRLDASDSAIALTPATLGYAGNWQGQGEPITFQLGMHGPLVWENSVLRYGWQRVLLRGDALVPTLEGKGAFAIGQQLVLRIDGQLHDWPKRWPALPAPLAHSRSPLPLTLDYVGAADTSGITHLQLRRDSTVLDAHLRLPQVLQWLDQPDASPLPPLDARLSTPELQFDGVQLRGVQIELSNDTP